ncbi:hypothetical protein CASFOL_037300 [Castilleja foliolosa]|uniref:Sec23/Sec24 trunk domain-containing protein n=1 Tax=Castilleja foliolosa TaxID=1961234 RepID=A0ABD3BNL0_9LAMI
MATDLTKYKIAANIYAFIDKYKDIASLGALAKYTSGQVYYYPSFQSSIHKDKLRHELIRDFTREAAWESVMRIRRSKEAAGKRKAPRNQKNGQPQESGSATAAILRNGVAERGKERKIEELTGETAFAMPELRLRRGISSGGEGWPSSSSFSTLSSTTNYRRLRHYWPPGKLLLGFPNRATTKSLFPASTRTSQLRLPPSSKLHSTVYKGKDLQITLSILKVPQFAGIDDVFTSSRGSTKTLGNFVKYLE